LGSLFSISLGLLKHTANKKTGAYYVYSKRQPLLFVGLCFSQFSYKVEKWYSPKMNKHSDMYKKPFFACFLCFIYAAATFGMALFNF
jgi:hypothetical protein